MGDFTVLSRQPGRRRDALLAPRARSFQTIEVIESHVHGLDLGGKPALYFGMAVLNGSRLLAEFDIGGTWNPNEFAAAVEDDLKQWLESEQRSPRWAVPGAQDFVKENLRATGLSIPILPVQKALETPKKRKKQRPLKKLLCKITGR